ncbi:winged helix-turn-helix domain-containing protein [Piscinibacter sakaiensis]|uniref:OmpR/PhoB-type domain-containing protein n=1 Tax=Piscinibacter sakaiensis TaxID=1547922 RepID=A0A0K8P1I6_PISS1|nr:winged helix-turn-helix domain-containing protein [Piscinibacter sakaiensis]GAP36527.1 hypothetical protein ISF6_2367 [Piscinibacter sakaiensis]
MSSSAPPPPALAFGPFVLDRLGGRLLRDGRPVELAPRPWALLRHLAEHPGRLVGKDELLDAVWGHRHVSDSALKVAVNALRAALADDAKAPQWLFTVARRGYRFSEDVRAIEGAGAPPGGVGASGGPAAGAADPAGAQGAPPSEAAGAAPGPAAAAGALAMLPAARRDGTAPPAAATTALPDAELAPAAAPKGNLPAAGRPLVGRAAAAEALRTLLQAQRLVTLTGPGGVGKTRLALAVAAEAVPADGVWLLRLEAFTDGDTATAALARTLGLPEAAGRSTEALGRALAPLSLRLLLDNAEHLVEPVAAAVSAWLAAAPALQVLVTSQRPLRVAGEALLPLRPLPPPPAGEGPQALAANPAVALLLQRVQAQDPDWRPDAAALDEAAAVARALDGLPLALELAAARVPLLGMAGVRERLGARLQLLTRGAADAPDRHRTLRAAIGWSIGLLSPEAAALLERLAVFAGSFRVEAVQAVGRGAVAGLDDWGVLEALQQLLDMALVVPAEGGAGSRRLRLYDSVRLLALERLAASGHEAAARDALRGWLLAVFRPAFDRLASTPLGPWLAAVEPEAEALQAAMAEGLARLAAAPSPALASTPAPDPAPTPTQPPAPTLRAELAELAALSLPFCTRVGLKHPSARWRAALQAAADVPPLPGDEERLWLDLHTALLASPGQVVAPAEGFAASERAWPRLAALGRTGAALYVGHHAGQLAIRLQAHARCTELVAALRALEPPEANLYERRWAGWLEALQSRVTGAVAAYDAFCATMLAESRERGDGPEGWLASMGLGQALYLQGRDAEAVAVLDAAVDEVRAAGRLLNQGPLVAQAAVLRLTRDGSPETRARVREAVRVLQTEGMVWWMADALSWLPLWEGRLDDARRIQAWADGLVAARAETRGPVFARVRAEWARRVDEALAAGGHGLGDAAAADAGGARADAGPPLDEAGALRLAGLPAGPAAPALG